MRKEIIIPIIITFILMNMASARSTVLHLEPSSIEDTNLDVGDTFSVDINVDDVTGLYAFQLVIDYNQDVLGNLVITEGPFLKQGGNTSCYGSISFYGCTFFANNAGVSGSGTLATVTFEVTDYGESDLEFRNTILVDYNVDHILHDVQNGYFSNAEMTTTTSSTTTTTSSSTTTTTTIRRSGGGRITTTTLCQESWSCSEWSECEDGEKTRICTDLNDCGTEEDKPVEKQTCETAKKPTGKVIKICQESWSCSEWSECEDGKQTRTCSDTNECGTIENKPIESQSCSVPETITGLAGMFTTIKDYSLYLALIVIIVIALAIVKIKFF